MEQIFHDSQLCDRGFHDAHLSSVFQFSDEKYREGLSGGGSFCIEP